jgi:hypothetical protein
VGHLDIVVGGTNIIIIYGRLGLIMTAMTVGHQIKNKPENGDGEKVALLLRLSILPKVLQRSERSR